MHRRIDGGSPDLAFAGTLLIRQLLARESPRCRVDASVVDRPAIDGDYRSRRHRHLAPAQSGLSAQAAASARFKALRSMVKAAAALAAIPIRLVGAGIQAFSKFEIGVSPMGRWSEPMALIFSIGPKPVSAAKLSIPDGERGTVWMFRLALPVRLFVKARGRTAR